MLLPENTELPFTTNISIIKIRITDGCNLRCRFCYVENSSKPVCLKNFDWVDRLVRQDFFKSVAILGGEPTLFPEACKKVADIARKYNKPSVLFTNGVQLMKDDIFDYFVNEVKPPVIQMSYNKYIKEQVDLVSMAKTLAAKFEKIPDIYFTFNLIIDNHHLEAFDYFVKNGNYRAPYKPELFADIEEELGVKCHKFLIPFIEPSCDNYDKSDLIEYEIPKGMLHCDMQFALTPDGYIVYDCAAGDFPETHFKHIDEITTDNPVEEIMRRKRQENEYIQLPEGYTGVYRYCRADPEHKCLIH